MEEKEVINLIQEAYKSGFEDARNIINLAFDEIKKSDISDQLMKALELEKSKK